MPLIVPGLFKADSDKIQMGLCEVPLFFPAASGPGAHGCPLINSGSDAPLLRPGWALIP